MKDHSLWQYDEYTQAGKGYSLPRVAAAYDSRHSDWRNTEKESNAVLDSLKIETNSVVIDLGSGTGTFAVQAALRGAKVYAVDVSQAMLDHAQAKALKAGISSIVFSHHGFLSFEFEDEAADAIVTTFAFHHLPDFWKGIALSRMYHMLKPGGQLYIHDVILKEHHVTDNIEALIALLDKLADTGSDFKREDMEGHFSKEFSTYDWIIDGLLSRAGFMIKSKEIKRGVLGTYYCTKNTETAQQGSE